MIIGLAALAAGLFLASCTKPTPVYEFPEGEERPVGPSSSDPVSQDPDNPSADPSGSPAPQGKPCFIWIDAAANSPDFFSGTEKIERDLSRAADAGFTHIVVDVRPTDGDLLYKSSHCDQVAYCGAWVTGGYLPQNWDQSFDYLQAFIDIGHELGLKVYAGFNTFVAGRSTSLGKTGICYRDPKMAALVTQLNTEDGIKDAMSVNGESGAIFFNPVHPDVQQYLISLLVDLAAYGKTGLDGIILDRGRFGGFQSDFSDYTKAAFEKYAGLSVANWPADVLPPGHKSGVASTKHFKKWVEFRAKVIYDFMDAARTAVKKVSEDIDFGAYVGGWYGSYYDNGVNWASRNYSTSTYYGSWATPQYKDYGFAELMDVLLIGAYANPGRVYGSSEWTMQGFCRLAYEKAMRGPRIVAGGPDVGNWDQDNNYTQAQENEAIVNSVKACADACDGYFLFDMIHLKKANQWKYAKQGIEQLNK